MIIYKLKLYLIMFWQYLYSFKGAQNANFYTDEECVNKLIHDRKSFIRYGDGEFDIIEGKSIHYQEYDYTLANELDAIIQEYMDSLESTSYIIGMPREYINCNGFFMLHSRLLMSCWSHARYLFKKKYDSKVIYGNAHLFAVGNESLFERIWKERDVQKVVFVHNDEKCSLHFEEKYKIRSIWVPIPRKNAFENIDQIYNSIIRMSNDENVLILVSAGPCGKILTYRLAKAGYWAVDTGHCWDEPLVLPKKG